MNSDEELDKLRKAVEALNSRVERLESELSVYKTAGAEPVSPVISAGAEHTSPEISADPGPPDSGVQRSGSASILPASSEARDPEAPEANEMAEEALEDVSEASALLRSRLEVALHLADVISPKEPQTRFRSCYCWFF